MSNKRRKLINKEDLNNFNARKAVIFYLVAVLILGSKFAFARAGVSKNAKTDVSSDAKGVVLGARVVRSNKESLTKLPTETYFASPLEDSIDGQLKLLGVTVYPEDELSYFPDPKMRLGSVIKVVRATPLKLVDGKEEKELRTWAQTVEELLAAEGIAVGEQDIVSPDLSSELTPNLEVKITRVETTILKVKKKIAYKTVTRKDPTLEKGKTRVVQAGSNGLKVLSYEVRRENGEEVERKLLKTEIERRAVDKIIALGTKEVLYGVGKATWFSAPALSAAHNSLPRGTRVKVTNTGNGRSVVVKIIGGGIKGGAIIDLSPDAFQKLAPLGTGVIQVRLTKA